jgi:hypothetical protein
MRKYRQLLITDFYTIINRKKTDSNFCIICNCDLGSQNPRQLCKKTYCQWFKSNF